MISVRSRVKCDELQKLSKVVFGYFTQYFSCFDHNTVINSTYCIYNRVTDFLSFSLI